MNIDFENLMANKSDEGLQEYLDNRAKFTNEAVQAAISEMKKRGRSFSEEELSTFKQEFQVRRENEEKEEKEFWSWGNKWKKNIVTDESAPDYYSEKAINLFSIFFTVIFGAILSAINFSKSGNKKAVLEVIGFGVGYTSLEIWILSQIPRNTGLTLAFNFGGALVLQYFWKKYIGKDTKYRSKLIWKPLIISILITFLILLSMIYSGTEN